MKTGDAKMAATLFVLMGEEAAAHVLKHLNESEIEKISKEISNVGPLAAGEPANIVLIDPSARAVVDRNATASLSRNNPWHGRELPDPVVATIWAGRVTYRKES